ncbi:MAG: IreB family regulatory phosphoprotein [Eubacteriales bacterium]|nr:IreB family regulatory phosphoprotein [Eubacteriales bacterium]
MNNTENTQVIESLKITDQPNAAEVLKHVYGALVEKGYDPINQIVGYIMSGDPTYITSHNNARSLIMKVERDEILEELMAAYVDERLRNN